MQAPKSFPKNTHSFLLLSALIFTIFTSCYQKKTVQNSYPVVEPQEQGQVIEQSRSLEEETQNLQTSQREVESSSENIPPLPAAKQEENTPKSGSPSSTKLIAELGTGGGSSVGNGGDAIECPNNNILGRPVIELFDYSEIRNLYKKNLEKKNEVVDTPIKQGLLALSRLQKLDPYRYEELLGLYQTMVPRITYVPSFSLNDVKDSKEIGIPTNCALTQVAVQQKLSLSADPEIFIAEDVFNRLSIVDQGGLILHEVLYRYFLDNYQVQDSKKVRYLNGLLGSNAFKEMTLSEYFYHLRQMGLSYKHPSSIEIDIQNSTFSSETALYKSSTGDEVSKIDLRHFSFDVNPHSPIEFWSNGNIKSIQAKELVFKTGYTQLNGQLKDVRLEFYPQGNLQLYKISFVETVAGEQQRGAELFFGILEDEKGAGAILPVLEIFFREQLADDSSMNIERLLLNKLVPTPLYFSGSKEPVYLTSHSYLNIVRGENAVLVSVDDKSEISINDSRELLLTEYSPEQHIDLKSCDIPQDLINTSKIFDLVNGLHMRKRGNLLSLEIEKESENPLNFFYAIIRTKKHHENSYYTVNFDHLKKKEEVLLKAQESISEVIIYYFPYGAYKRQAVIVSPPTVAWEDYYVDLSNIEFSKQPLFYHVKSLVDVAGSGVNFTRLKETIYSNDDSFSLGTTLEFPFPASFDDIEKAPNYLQQCVRILRGKH